LHGWEPGSFAMALAIEISLALWIMIGCAALKSAELLF
jgi:hypothetical protein